MRLRAAAAALLAVLAFGCSPGQGTGAPAPADHPGGIGVAHASQLPAGASVFVMVLENRSYDDALQMPAVASLTSRYGLATDYHGVAHPSLPNYLALTSGSTHGIKDDGYHRLPVTGIGDELSRQKIPWRAYMDGMTNGCFDSPPPYAVKHNPFAYYGGACPPNVVPLQQLEPDLGEGSTPRFVWITPNLCNDGHDCPPATADKFLADWSARIMASSAWKRGGVLYVVWDEADTEAPGSPDGGNRVACLVISPELASTRSGTLFNHYSLLATMEDQLGVSRSDQAGGVDAMTPFFHSR